MTSLGRAGLPPRFYQGRASVVVAALLVLLTLAVSPRSLAAARGNAPRRHDARRLRLPRHIVTEGTFRVARETGASRPPGRRAPRPGLEGPTFKLPCGPTVPLPGRVALQLAQPDYLHLFKDPQRQTSPPA